MTRSAARPRRFVPLVALVGLAILGGATDGAARDHPGAAAGPTLTGAVAVARAPGTVAVTGEAFTPGGAVHVALYDRWGETLHETRATAAGAAAFGPNGSADPARGFRRGGDLREAFGGLCGTTPMVRAYDRQAAAWSNWLEIAAPGAGSSIFGANGSQDPALGFRAAPAAGAPVFGPNGSRDPAAGFAAGC